MKKLLWTISFLSVGLNIYLVKFEKNRVDEITQNVGLTISAPIKENSRKIELECPQHVTPKTTLMEKPQPTEKLPDGIDSSFDYDDYKKQSTEKIEQFIVEDLNLNLETSAHVIRIFEEGQKEFDDHLKEKREHQKTKEDGEDQAYFFDAFDYIKLGRNRLDTRRKLQNLLGDKTYINLEKFFKQQQREEGLAFELL